jgi:hypothetical protein
VTSEGGICLLRNLAPDRGGPRNGAIDRLRLARHVLRMTRLPSGLHVSALMVSAFWKEVLSRAHSDSFTKCCVNPKCQEIPCCLVERLHGEWTGLGVFRGICFIKIQEMLVCLSFGNIETSSSLDKGIKLETKSISGATFSVENTCSSAVLPRTFPSPRS